MTEPGPPSDPAGQLARLIDAAIIMDHQGRSQPPIFVWRLGLWSGHEPTYELARQAVLRVARINPEG